MCGRSVRTEAYLCASVWTQESVTQVGLCISACTIWVGGSRVCQRDQSLDWPLPLGEFGGARRSQVTAVPAPASQAGGAVTLTLRQSLVMHPSCWDPVWPVLVELPAASPARGRDGSAWPSSRQLALSKEQTQRHAGWAVVIPDIPPGGERGCIFSNRLSYPEDEREGGCCQEICIYIHMYTALAACTQPKNRYIFFIRNVRVCVASGPALRDRGKADSPAGL